MLIEKGRVCIKTAGKERNKLCVIVDIIDDKFVLIDGLVKKRKCNINHLKFLDKVLKLKNFDKSSIIKAFVEEGLLTKEKYEKIKKKLKNAKKEKRK